MGACVGWTVGKRVVMDCVVGAVDGAREQHAGVSKVIL